MAFLHRIRKFHVKIREKPTCFSRENNIHSFRFFSTGESKNHGISLLRGSDCVDQPVQLDRGRCNAPAPCYFYKYGKLVCRGAGDSHLPRSMRARSPHVLSPRRRFQPLRDEHQRCESRRAQRMTAGDSAGALELEESSSRH